MDRLAALIRSKRGNKGLRQIAAEIDGVSSSTLSRVENGKTPDMDTFLKLCDWLEISPNSLIISTLDTESPPEISELDTIVMQLRANKELDPTMAKALADMVRAAAENAAGKSNQVR
ncbi:MAG: helix-turn-helix transcriptional regulator [Okeania sp. SIO3B3]|nr:helix-turn-helix transcriptional regulator [Okeania sp. SIO3B3]